MSGELDFWLRDGLLVWRYFLTDCDGQIRVTPYIEGDKAANDELYARMWGCRDDR